MVFIGLMMAEPHLAGLLAGAVDERWLYGLRSAVTAGLLAVFWRHYTELRPSLPAPPRAWAWGVGVGVAVFLLWILLDFGPLVIGEADPFDPTVGGRIHPGLALTRLAGAALVVPVMEELFWRSFIMRWIHHPRFLDVRPGAVGLRGLLVSSVVFAAEHRLWFAGLLAGLAYGELYRRTGDLRVVVVAHAVTNALLGGWVLYSGAWGFW